MEMDMFSKIIAVLVGIFLVWMLFRYVRSNPESLSWGNINKSMYSMGILAVGLFVFIAVIIMLLKSGS